ncbi:MAG: glycosyltransferase family 4 protein [Alphaproteobacteria bacterium]|nr:glycosyltransferase family 4 protein [Alphaproteobacteria bacterium]
MKIFYAGFDIEGVGGIATYSRHQIRALKTLGCDVFALSIDKQDKFAERGLVDRRFGFDGKTSTVVRALTTMTGQRFDAVMVNHVYLAGLGLAARRFRRTPYAINVYNIDILCSLPRWREFAFARADLVMADCRYTIANMPKFHPQIPPTGLLYDPVDVSFFRPIPAAAARAEVMKRFPAIGDISDRFVCVTVAHMAGPPNNNKGHRQTIEALARMKDPRFLYLVVGDGPDRAAIEAHVRAHGVEDSVFLAGLVPQDALPFLYACADAAILIAKGGPGLGEAVPLGLLEAAAAGVPFICGDEDGSIEAIDPARPNGIAISPMDIDALVAALRRLAGDEAARRAMGVNGKHVVDDVFRFERFVEVQGRLLAQHLGFRGAKARARPEAA